MLELSAEGYYRQTQNNLTYKPGADFFLSQFIENEITQAQGKATVLNSACAKTGQ